LWRVETPGERTALAALVALPQFRCRIVIDHACDIDRKIVDRIDAVALRWAGVFARDLTGDDRSDRRTFFARGAGKKIGEPAAVAGSIVILAAGNRAERGWP